MLFHFFPVCGHGHLVFRVARYLLTRSDHDFVLTETAIRNGKNPKHALANGYVLMQVFLTCILNRSLNSMF